MLWALLFFVAGRCLVPMDETDLYFNLRLGEIILETGRVPTTNLLSFTYPDAPDVNLAWVFQILLALVHRVAGIAGTVLLKTTFVVGVWAVLFRVAIRRGAHPAVAAAALALAAWAAEPRFVERPHLVTFLGLSLVLLALERAEQGRPRMLWALIPAGLVWVNANSCFFLAPAVLALYGLGAFADGRRADARRALAVAAALAPLIFVTPSGAGCLRYLANHIRMPWVRPLQEYRTAEWPLDGPFFFLVAGLAVAAAAGRTRAVPWRTLLPLVALGLLGARRIRFVAEFAILAGPALAAAATRLAPSSVFGRWSVPAVGLAIAGLAVVPRVQAAIAGRSIVDLGVEEGLVPHDAIAFVERHGLRERMYNDMEVGSYLTWHGWPRHRVFQDPRINGYPDELHTVLKRPDLAPAEMQALLDRFQVTAALLSYPDVNPRGALFPSARWALVYRAADALVFARRTPRNAAVIAARELPLGFRYDPATGLEPVPLGTAPAGSPVSPCEWAVRLAELFAERHDEARALAHYRQALAAGGCTDDRQRATRRALGALALRGGDAAEALRALAGLDDDEANVNRAYALFALGRHVEALEAFNEVSVRAPRNDSAAYGRAMALDALGRRDEAAALYRATLKRAPQHPAATIARKRLGERPSP